MEAEGIIVIIGIVVQSIVYRFNRLASAIIGIAVTAFVLVFGLLVYGSGDAVMIIGQTLSQTVFIIVCAAWFVADLFVLIKAIRARKAPPAVAGSKQ